jgi:hypothetical protein
MRRQDWQGALGLLRQALQANPEYPQALWNRGVVFRELGVTELAEHDFAAVEALDESGWSGEAYTLVTELRRERAERQRHRAAEVARLLERLSSDGRLPDEELKARPVLARAALYEAVRSAESTSRVKGLLPLATALDQLDGGEPLLRGYVHQVAARDFTVRAPLARAYAALLRDPNASSAELLERLRASGERDILLGALLRERSRAEHEELLRLARESNEPLFILLSEREVTRRELAAGHRQRAEQRLLSALRTCQAAKLPRPVCAGLD